MTHPTFSVIIPAYNAARTVCATLRTVLDQTCADFEVLVVDDGSRDETVCVALRYAAGDQRVRVVSQPNKGVSAARNFGAELAHGQYLAFLDADDQWAPDKLERHLTQHLADPELDASFARVLFCADSEGRLEAGSSVSAMVTGPLNIVDALVENPVCTASNLVMTASSFRELGGFDENLRHAEDQEILALLLSGGRKVRCLDAPLVLFRLNKDGLSADFDAMFESWRGVAAQWLTPESLAYAEATYCRYLTRRALRLSADLTVGRRVEQRDLNTVQAASIAKSARAILTAGGSIARSAPSPAIGRTLFAPTLT